MTNELEKQFFDTFGIEPHIRHWQQYNFAQVENGLKLFPERQKLADEGYIKITCKKLNPTEFNDCVYWEEYHYPQITDTHYLKLICILSKELRMIFRISSENLEDIKKEILQKCISNYYCYSDELAPNHQWFYEYGHQVRTLFEEAK